MSIAMKPPCGATGSQGGSQWALAAALWGFILLVLGTLANFVQIGEFFAIIGKSVIAAVAVWLLISGSSEGVVQALLAGVDLATAGIIAFGAVTGAVGVISIVLSFWVARCKSIPQGVNACSSGVVNDVVTAFNSPVDFLFPFAAVHPRVDVVVQRKYWNLVTVGNPARVNCAACTNCPADIQIQFLPGECSPVLVAFYHSNLVCAAGLGSVIGAFIGGLIGITVGTVVGVVIAAGGGFWLALLGFLVALFIGAVAALAGAFVGGHIAELLAPSDSQPSRDGTSINVGDYITTRGNLIASDFANGGNCYWFTGWFPVGTDVVDQTTATHSGTTLHGCSSGSAPFCWTDPDQAFQGLQDGCPVV